MSANAKNGYVGYEYKEVTVQPEQASLFLDCYQNFGWIEDTHFNPAQGSHFTVLRLKRDRKIINKMELTRLQQHFEACVQEIEALEKEKNALACAVAITVALIGTAFIAGSTFAAVHVPPIIWLCILLAIPGFTGWILPNFIYRKIVRERTQKIQPLINAKREEIYEICEKGHSLL